MTSPDVSTRTPVTTPEQLFARRSPEPSFSQDSIKADIIPVIQNLIDVSSEKLFSLSVDTLNQIFGFLEAGTIPNSEIESIIRSTSDESKITPQLQAKVTAGTTSAPADSYKEDIITGILFNIPESVRGQIEPKLRELEGTNELVELSQLDLPELQSKLGIETPAPQRYDEGLDLRAGILAQIPPSLRGVIGDRLNEIEDLDQLYRLSQMNYVQVQQSLGLAPQSASQVPPELANPVDTATETPSTTSAPSVPSDSQTSEPTLPPEQKERLEAQRRQRLEENKKHIPLIQKMAEKFWKVKLSEGAPQSSEVSELKEKIDILLRTHSIRVERILDVLKRTKDRKRFKALFDWYVYSQRIEEIETYVEHWQGQVQGIGGFRAAINVSRFDPIIEHLPTKEIQGIDIQAKKALDRVHGTNINTRARGVEDIKQISNYLLQKAR